MSTEPPKRRTAENTALKIFFVVFVAGITFYSNQVDQICLAYPSFCHLVAGMIFGVGVT